jgi:hypothetical protein
MFFAVTGAAIGNSAAATRPIINFFIATLRETESVYSVGTGNGIANPNTA